MYRIRLTSGEETVFRTVEELARGIQSGVVKPDAEIFHAKSEKWLPIHTHPAYKSAQTGIPLASETIAAPPVAARPPVATPPAPPSPPSPPPRAAQEHNLESPETLKPPPGLTHDPEFLLPPPKEAESPSEFESWRSDRPVARGRRSTSRRGLWAAAAALLVAAAAFGTWRLLAARGTAQPASVTADSVVAAPPESQVVASASGANPGSASATTPPSGGLPAVTTPEALIRRYGAAFDSARNELDTAVFHSRLTNLFVPGRLSSADSLKDARAAVALVGGHLARYRSRAERAEQEGRDSSGLLAKSWTPFQVATWNAKPSRLERDDAGHQADSLLRAFDGVLAVLAQRVGTYQVSPESIVFDESAAQKQYAAARELASSRLTALLNAAGPNTPASLAILLRAIGTNRPPVGVEKALPAAPALPGSRADSTSNH